MAGTTNDALTSNFLEVCVALEKEPDEVLMIERSPMEDALRDLYEAAKKLPEEDQWLVVDIIRNIINQSKRL